MQFLPPNKANHLLTSSLPELAHVDSKPASVISHRHSFDSMNSMASATPLAAPAATAMAPVPAASNVVTAAPALLPAGVPFGTNPLTPDHYNADGTHREDRGPIRRALCCLLCPIHMCMGCCHQLGGALGLGFGPDETTEIATQAASVVPEMTQRSAPGEAAGNPAGEARENAAAPASGPGEKILSPPAGFPLSPSAGSLAAPLAPVTKT